ncbi:hypothetical protein IMZ48_35500 [Candidatus Bathyarchaeota archaeon]|nr:hypothetical protein [Candidatus Bathyarchaeota archaeon]
MDKDHIHIAHALTGGPAKSAGIPNMAYIWERGTPLEKATPIPLVDPLAPVLEEVLVHEMRVVPICLTLAVGGASRQPTKRRIENPSLRSSDYLEARIRVVIPT